MRVLMTGGGTAGHINPALAIADTIKMNDPTAVVEFVGTERGLENSLVVKAGYKLHHVDIMGISRSLSLSNVKALYLMLKSQIQAKRIIREFKPDIVIGTGGYVCWPALKVASRLGIPTVAHESNARPGLAIRQLQGSLDRILVNFPETANYIKQQDKVLRVGNPIRGGFGMLDRAEARKKLAISDSQVYILAFGGSLGAQRVNDTVYAYMRDRLRGRPSVVCHLGTGREYFRDFSERFRADGLDREPSLRLLEYIHDMPQRMSAADLIICRAGAMTISELAALGSACVMIPSPNVVDNHQYKNAKVLSDAGAVVMLEEDTLGDDIFNSTMEELIESRKKRESLGKSISKFSCPDANKLIYDEIVRLVSEKK